MASYWTSSRCYKLSKPRSFLETITPLCDITLSDLRKRKRRMPLSPEPTPARKSFPSYQKTKQAGTSRLLVFPIRDYHKWHYTGHLHSDKLSKPRSFLEINIPLPHCSLRLEEEEDGVFSTELTPVQKSCPSYQKTKQVGTSRLEIQLLCFDVRRQRTPRVRFFFSVELGGVSFGEKCGTDHLRVGYICFFVYSFEVGEFGSYGDEEVVSVFIVFLKVLTWVYLWLIKEVYGGSKLSVAFFELVKCFPINLYIIFRRWWRDKEETECLVRSNWFSSKNQREKEGTTYRSGALVLEHAAIRTSNDLSRWRIEGTSS